MSRGGHHFLLAGVTAVILSWLAPAAQATIVYGRPAKGQGGFGNIVAARNDGTRSHVIAYGEDPVISPNGRYVAFVFPATPGRHSLRLVSIHGGRSRKLVANTNFTVRVAWSSDSRLLVAAGQTGGFVTNGVFVVDVSRRTRRFIPVEQNQFSGASFSPDNSSIVLVDESLGSSSGPGSSTLDIVSLRSGHRRTINRDVSEPLWLRAGIVYLGGYGVRIQRPPDRRSQTLHRPPHGTGLATLNASADDRTVLFAQATRASPEFSQALLLNVHTKATTLLPTMFSEIDEISRDAQHVLGVVNGNVVSVERNGTTHILAGGASSPTWNA